MLSRLWMRRIASAKSGATDTIVTRGEIRPGQSLGSSLRRQGISPGTVHLIASEMRKELKGWFDDLIKAPRSFTPTVFQIGWKGKQLSEIPAFGH